MKQFRLQMDLCIRLIATAVVLFSFTGIARADQYDDQINAIKQEIAAQQAQVNAFAAQADTLQNKVDSLNAQIAQTNNQLALLKTKFNKVSADLDAAEKKLAIKKAILDESVRAIYIDGQVTPIEILASSGSISEFLDKQQYQEKLKDSVEDAITEVTALKAQLEKERKDLTSIIGEQQVLQQSLSDQRNEVASLLEQTQGQEAVYQQQVAANNARVAQLRAQQAAAMTARFGGGAANGSACGGGYPGVWCNAAPDTLVDSWGMYNRECVSYAAWAMAVKYGHHMPYWGGRGNANQWPDNARAAGIPVDNTPSVGSVAIWYVGYYGHAMVVDAVSGGNVTVSQYNYGENHTYSTMTVPAGNFVYIHFR